MRHAVLLATLTVGLAHGADGPLAPNEALASFQLEFGLRAELVAAEPLTASPCALTWDERGRLLDRKSTRLNSSHIQKSRMPSSA